MNIVETSRTLIRVSNSNTSATESILFRFYALNELDVYVDTVKLAEYDDLADWMREFVELDDEVVDEICNRDIQPIDWSGWLTVHFCNDYGFRLPEFKEALEAVEQHGVEVVDAAITLGIPTDKISDTYVGQWDSHKDYAEEHVQDSGLLENVPEILQRYIDYENLGEELCQDFNVCDGYYFNSDY